MVSIGTTQEPYYDAEPGSKGLQDNKKIINFEGGNIYETYKIDTITVIISLYLLRAI